MAGLDNSTPLCNPNQLNDEEWNSTLATVHDGLGSKLVADAVTGHPEPSLNKSWSVQFGTDVRLLVKGDAARGIYNKTARRRKKKNSRFFSVYSHRIDQ